MRKIWLLFLLLSLPVTALSKELVWVAAHNPGNQQVRDLLTRFQARVKENSKGELTIKFDFLSDDVKNRHSTARDKVMSGEAQMSQVSVAVLFKYAPEFQVLAIPYLLRSHEDSRKVINGETGRYLLKTLLAKTDNKIYGLDFTYSGGFRVFYGKAGGSTPESIKGLRVPVPESGPSKMFFDLLGAKYIPFPATRRAAVDLQVSGGVDIEENELNRFGVLSDDYPKLVKYSNQVTETNHIVYLTTIIANASAFEGLRPALQIQLQEDIKWLAAQERELSIQQATEYKEKLLSKGVKFHTLDAAAEAMVVGFGNEIREKMRAQIPEAVRLAESDLKK